MPITFFDGDYYMSSNGLYCGINAPPAKTSGSGRDLPPYAKCQAFLTDDYLRVPKNWMESSGRTASYFVGVPKNHGLWIDLNKNNQHTHEVAVVISIQGINPITGLPCNDPQLEQYIDDCPKCKSKFKANRYCESCGYHWPKQNYISSNAQPNGAFWLDGFRSAEGIIRQWIFSEEEKKGVAANIIGEDRVYAIGLSFFLSKEKKTQPVAQFTRSISNSFNHVVTAPYFWTSNSSNDLAASYITKSMKKSTKKSKGGGSSIQYSSEISDEISSGGGASADSNGGWPEASSPVYTSYVCDSINVMSEAEAKAKRSSFHEDTSAIDVTKLEMAAGNEIDQTVHNDPESLDFWRDEPEAIIVINYAFEEEIREIVKGGKKPKKLNKEGFLAGIPVGN